MLRFAMLWAIAACYQPAATADDCTLTCMTAADCPSGVCTGGRCAATTGACDSVDSGVDVPEGVICIGTGLLGEKCFDPVGSVTFSTTSTLDTDGLDGLDLCDQTVTDACYVVGNSIAVTGLLRVTGTRPLVLWSASVIEISGILDAGSHIADARGPAADPALCEVLTGRTNESQSPFLGGGGGGGANESVGGRGGQGRSGMLRITNPSLQGVMKLPLSLQGGCPGGNRGLGSAVGGSGGGALYLMARDTIRVFATGIVSVAGAAGGAGIFAASQRDGGGGGGSGGMVGFDAPAIVVEDAFVTALGGGGGSGSNSMTSGSKGVDGAAGQQATGGAQTVGINAGGNGCNLDGANADNGGAVLNSDEGGGGGGGGAAGYIRMFGRLTETGSSIAPPPTP